MATGVLVAVALAAQAVLLPSLPSSAALRFTDLVELVRRPHPRRSLLMVALVFGAHFSSYTYIAPFLLRDAGFSESGITWVLLGFGIIGFVSNFAVSTVVGRNLKGALLTMVVLLLTALVTMPFFKHYAFAVTAVLMAWGIAFGAIPLCMSVWIQRATPDLPEAGSAMFVGIIQVAIAVGSSVGGTIVDRAGIATDFRFGAVLAILGIVAISTLTAAGEPVRVEELDARVGVEKC